MIEEITKDLQKGVICWCDVDPSNRVLCITEDNHPIIEYLEQHCRSVMSCSNIEHLREREQYDMIISLGIIEYEENPSQVLGEWKKLLTEEGKLLLAVENRLGIRYFAGDQDPYTKRNFDGIEGYTGTGGPNRGTKGRIFSRNEITTMLQQAGFGNQKFYAVLPNLEFTQQVYAQDYLPEEELSVRYFPKYNSPQTIFLNEERLYSDLVDNNLFHEMANAYLVECPLNNQYMEIKHATISLERGKKHAMATIIYRNETVKKKPLYEEGMEKLIQLKENEGYLKNRGIQIVEGTCTQDAYVMPYIHAQTGVKYLQEVFWRDKKQFEHEIEKFYEIILRSSVMVGEDEKLGPILERGYVDLIPLNAFAIEGTFLFYDQELYYKEYPAKAILYRAITIVYTPDMNKELPMNYFWKKYQMEEQLFARRANDFINELRNINELRFFWKPYEKDGVAIHINRQRMNYSLDEYARRFQNIFDHIDGKKVILFGSGLFAEHFITVYKKDVNIEAIVDNNQHKWGKCIEGIEIQSPSILDNLKSDEVRIVICIKQYHDITQQLKCLGISEYVIYDKGMTYKRPIKEKAVGIEDVESKKYKRGYIAGVFDMFHVGHLNLIRKAKEQCEYLIVGVVSDRGVRENKQVEPVILLEQRLEIVGACKYVDEVVEIPFEYPGTQDAYKRYQFDCQFSGSDYVNDPGWLSEKAFLESKGVDLVFFPYTESVSTSKLKKELGVPVKSKI